MEHFITVQGYKAPVALIISELKTKYPEAAVSTKRSATQNTPLEILVIDAGFSAEGPTLRSYGVVVSAFWAEKVTRSQVVSVADVIEETVLSLPASMSSGVRDVASSGVEFGTVPDSDYPFITLAFDLLVGANRTLRAKIKR